MYGVHFYHESMQKVKLLKKMSIDNVKMMLGKE